MWLLADRFVAAFTSIALPNGWRVDYIDEDDYIVYARHLAPGLTAELGVDLTQREWGLSLNPALSVRHVEVSELSAQFFGFDRGASQAGASLSDLMHDAGEGAGLMWTVESIDEAEPTARKVLSYVEAFGASFYARYSSLEDVVRHLEQSAKTDLEYAQLAIAFAVSGEHDKAIDVVSRLERLAREQPDLLAQQTTRFVLSFRGHFSTSS